MKIIIFILAFGLMLEAVYIFGYAPKSDLVKPELKTQSEVIFECDRNFNTIGIINFNVSDIHYRIFTNSIGAMYVVNVTKDSLEILNLKK